MTEIYLYIDARMEPMIPMISEAAALAWLICLLGCPFAAQAVIRRTRELRAGWSNYKPPERLSAPAPRQPRELDREHVRSGI